MIRLPKFEYKAPKTIDEAISILSGMKGDAKIIAGGTDILVALKQRRITPKYLVSLKEIPGLEYIRNGENCVKIGALSTLTSIAESDIVKEKVPILAKAASCVGFPHLRNSGTMGGNLCLNTRCWYYNQSDFYRKCRPVCYKFGSEEDKCQLFPSPKGKKNRCYAVYSGDTGPALKALQAEVRIIGPKGEKVIPLSGLFTGDGKEPFALGEGEILTEVTVPNSPPYCFGIYLKYRQRQAIDFPLVGVAVTIALDSKGGVCESANVVIGAVAPQPIEINAVEEIFKGNRITDDLIEEAGQLAYKGAKPLSTVLACSPKHRKQVVKVLVKRAIKLALQEINAA